MGYSRPLRSLVACAWASAVAAMKAIRAGSGAAAGRPFILLGRATLTGRAPTSTIATRDALAVNRNDYELIDATDWLAHTTRAALTGHENAAMRM